MSFTEKELTPQLSHISIIVKIPTLPNFVKAQNDIWIDIAELSDEELLSIAKNWTSALLSHAAKRRKNNL